MIDGHDDALDIAWFIRQSAGKLVLSDDRSLDKIVRDTLDHPPQSKQRELVHIVRVLFEEFEAMHERGNQKWAKQGRIPKVLLYGSCARGDWVDDPVGGCKSDRDILVVVSDDRLPEFEFWSPAEDRLMRDTTIINALTAPVSFIVYCLNEVKAQLERGIRFQRYRGAGDCSLQCGGVHFRRASNPAARRSAG